MGISNELNINGVNVSNLVQIYLALAKSFPALYLVPNWPFGAKILILFDPTKFCAIPIIAPLRDISPWWYAARSDTKPANWETFTSSFSRPRKKAPYKIFLCDGLKPSIIDGIERSKSSFEKCIKSEWIKS